MNSKVDIVIIGGGPAGLTAALTAARGNRSVLIFDDNQPRNAPAEHMMNFPSQDGTPPADFKAAIKNDLAKYSLVSFSEKRIDSITRFASGFIIDGIEAKKILLAHGVVDILPPIPGLRELFGKAIFHCPYCHGYEYLKSPMGIIGSGEMGHHFSTIVGGLSKDLIQFTNGIKEENSNSHIPLFTEEIMEFLHVGNKLTGIKLASGKIVERNYLFFRPQQKLSSEIGIKLGCELTETGLYKVNEMGQTSQPGIYAAGDITHLRQSVLAACSLGQFAGAAMNFEILNESRK